MWVAPETTRPVFRPVFLLCLIAWQVTCDGGQTGPAGPSDSSTGSIEVAVTTSGEAVDPDGYTVSVDGSAGRAIAVEGNLTVEDVSVGVHSVALQGLAQNCAVQGGNPRSVTVSENATATVAFSVTCSRVTGSIQVAVATVGGTDPDGYTVMLDSGSPQAVGANDTTTFTDVTIGAHSVELSGFAQGCGPQGANPQAVTVIGNRTTQIGFTVACASGFVGRIVFHSARDGDDEIFVMNADGSNPVQLTHNDGLRDRHPNWSPDGTRIVYAGDIGDNFNTEVVVMNADGSNQVNITNAPLYDGSPGWSPDGTRIVFETNRDDPNGFEFFNDGDPQEIYVVNANGTGLTRVTNRAGIDVHPDYSPDGSRIAFAADLSGLGTEEIFVMDVDGSNLVNLTNSAGMDLRPAWSPDGSKIAFHSNRNGNFDIFVINADGTGLTQLTNSSGNEFSPDWSPDGRAIAFAGRLDGGNDAEIVVINADGTGATQLTSNNGIEDNGPSWAE